MLILVRKKGEKIMIGDDIVITVLNTNDMYARIGIDAPREIEVHRREVYDHIQSGDPEKYSECKKRAQEG